MALGLGSDNELVLVAWVGLVTLITLNLHLRLRRQTQMVTALTRQMDRVVSGGQQESAKLEDLATLKHYPPCFRIKR